MAVALRQISGQRKQQVARCLCQGSFGAPPLKNSATENNRCVTLLDLGNLEIRRTVSRLSEKILIT